MWIFNARSTPTAPTTGKKNMYMDTADRRIKFIDEKGIISAPGDSALKNWLANSGFWWAQRQVPATLTTYSVVNGRIYAADCWFVGNENASVQYQRVDTGASPETGLQSRYYGRIKKLTSAGKMYIGQPLLHNDSTQLRGRVVRFQCKLRCSVASSMNVRLGLMQLNSSGTADTIPNTANLFFTAAGAAGTDPTPGANLAYIAPKSSVTPEGGAINGNAMDCALTTSWQTFSACFDVPTNYKNLIPIVWTNGLPAANDEMNISEASLTDGYERQDWSPWDWHSEFSRILPHYVKTFAVETAPATNAGVTTGCLRAILGKAAATALAAQFQWRFPINMWKAPATVVLYNPGAANAQVRQIGGTAADLTASASANITEQSVDVTATGAAGGTVGDQVGIHLSAEAFL